jgi:hypothetical protein
MHVRQVLTLLFLLFLCGFQSIKTYGQVVATWTDSSGNWSNSANWSTLTVPNNGGGKSYDVVINGTGADTITFDASNTTINSLTLGPGETFKNNGVSQLLTAQISTSGGTFIWQGGSLNGGIESDDNGIVGVVNSNVALAGIGSVLGGTVQLGGCIGTIGDAGADASGDLGLLGSNLIGGDLHVGLSSSLEITDSALLVRNVQSVNEGAKIFIAGSAVIASGGIFVGYGTSAMIDNSSLTVGGFGTSEFTYTSIQNGSVVITNGFINNWELDVDRTSSLTVLGDFLNTDDASIGGAFIVNGVLENGGGSVVSMGGSSSIHAVQNQNFGFMSVTGPLIVTGGGLSNQAFASLTLFGVANVTGGFTNSGGSVILNPSATLTSDRYSQSGGSTDVSGILSTASYKQSGGDTIVESGGTISATTFKATGGTVTVNGTLDPTAVEIGSGATLQGTGKIVGNVAMSGTMIPGGPGAPGTFTIFGNYEQAGNGILREFISSSSSGLLNVNGDVALNSDSILSITLLGGFNPLGDTFTIMDYASLVGQFSNGSSFWDDGFLWDVNYGANQIDITAVRSPEPSSLLLLCMGFAALALCAQRKMAKTRLSA